VIVGLSVSVVGAAVVGVALGAATQETKANEGEIFYSNRQKTKRTLC
jgi:hypothetical protein